MASILFNPSRGFVPDKWDGETLYAPQNPKRINPGEYIYICHRGEVRFRARFKQALWRKGRPTGDGQDKGPGWVWHVERMEQAPPGIPRQKVFRSFNYLKGADLW